MVRLYLRQRRKGAAAFLLCAAVYLCCLVLFEVPWRAAAYAGALCAFLLLLFLIPDYLGFRRRHRCLQRLLTMPETAADALPDPVDPIEADYAALIRALRDDRLRRESVLGRRYDAMVEYYTVWAHQIKTPIAAMRLLLQQEPDAPRTRAVSEELQKIEQYVEMVLCYLRLSADSTDFVLRTCDLDAVVRQAVRRYAAQFITKKLRLDYEPLHCTVLTDEKWLLFVVEQVLSNALKYTRQGGVSIYLEAPKTLCIRDTGVGIDPADLPRIFELGFTGENGRRDKRATGIGLGLSRRILQKLGHGISAESAPGVGTTVRIALDQAPLEVE